ncbi:hypothetical protein A2115_03125 [Candidatus Woesebacteria bacterium GWA1_41_8]|uniref:NAD-dependent epimerase/dehydratase domain-containing protein n=1 Tax=Candidatus Woesebacteria bacterium GWA1_41_8 TaxID=1802471 RepID=A0A1F7WJV4_9BACT|nr:MAG: hypothetical protein A2115_03125 [Candidatus Woesebacteria bacterium GWA1_41_8]
MKKVLIAGAGGYLGTKLTKYLLAKGYEIIALDRFFFGDTLSSLSQNKNLIIIKDDIRFIDDRALKDVDVVVNLAAISNDPAGDLNLKITREINLEGAVRLASLAKKKGVKKYIFSSSCSVYGVGEGELVEESRTAPVSEYGRSKVEAETALLAEAGEKFCVTVLRMATLYGLSESRMRFDLIINVMTLHAWRDRKIYIMGGGKQWRPLLHIDDAVRAFELILMTRKLSLINKRIFNVGSNSQNFQVFQIANRFKKHFRDLSIEVAPGDPDPRSYKVNFDKINKLLDFEVKKTIDDGIKEIKIALENGTIADDLKTNTLKYYQYLMESEMVLNSIKIRDRLF